MAQLPPNQASWGFAGVATFLRAPLIPDGAPIDADIAVIGVPSDSGSPFLPGSRMGPRSIREHSIRFGSDGFYDHRRGRTYLESVLGDRRLVDLGDVDVALGDTEVTFERTTALVGRALAAEALPVVLGGDHAITFPVVRAYPDELHVVHFDAHIDYSPFEHGFMYSNMHAFRHIRRLPNVLSLTQVGIRSIRNKRDAVEDSLTDGNRVIDVTEFRDLGSPALAGLLPDGANCYVSIDIDVLDLPLVPGCVSAEPDGLSYSELRDAVEALSQHANVVGFDVVEVNPTLDVRTGITSYLAAHTAVEFLGHITAQPRWSERHEQKSAQSSGS